MNQKELPPRARRIPHHFRINHAESGTTSACAENTCVCGHTSVCLGNYLRVRGEYEIITLGDRMDQELPPRARRIPAGAAPDLHTIGTTSACAENTFGRKQPKRNTRNYLRVRGEYWYVH